MFLCHICHLFLFFCQESQSRWIFILIPKNRPNHFSPQIHTLLCVTMPSFSSEMEEETTLSGVAMHRTMDQSHRNNSDSSYCAPKGKSIDPDDDDPDEHCVAAVSALRATCCGVTLGMAETWCAKKWIYIKLQRLWITWNNMNKCIQSIYLDWKERTKWPIPG